MIIKVVIWSKKMAAELKSIAQAAVSYLFLMFLSFNVDLKLLGTGKIGVIVIIARPWRFRDRSSDWQVNYGIRTWSFHTTRRRRSWICGGCRSCSIAESSRNKYYLLLGSTTETNVLESGKREGKEKRRTNSCSWSCQIKSSVWSERKRQKTQTGRAAKKM